MTIYASVDAASPAGQAARAQAMRLLSAAGGERDALYFDELRRVLDELLGANDEHEYSSWLAMLIDALVAVANGATAVALDELHREGVEIDREGLLLAIDIAIDRRIKKFVADRAARGS